MADGRAVCRAGVELLYVVFTAAFIEEIVRAETVTTMPLDEWRKTVMFYAIWITAPALSIVALLYPSKPR